MSAKGASKEIDKAGNGSAAPTDLATLTDELHARRQWLKEQIEPLERELAEIEALIYGPEAGRGGSSRAAGPLSDAELRTALLEAIRAEPGKPGSHYAAGVGVSALKARNALDDLVEQVMVVRRGERRGTRYFPA